MDRTLIEKSNIIAAYHSAGFVIQSWTILSITEVIIDTCVDFVIFAVSSHCLSNSREMQFLKRIHEFA